MAAAIENIMVTQSSAELEDVFRAHQSCVLKAAYRVTGSMADAEDVAQSVFLRLARGTIDHSRISNLQSYLHRSAVNAALDLIRARGHREVVPVEAADELQANPSLSPERTHSSMEIKNWLRRRARSAESPHRRDVYAALYRRIGQPRNRPDDEYLPGCGCGHAPSDSGAAKKEPPWHFERCIMKFFRSKQDAHLDRAISELRGEVPDAKTLSASAERVWQKLQAAEGEETAVSSLQPIRGCADIRSLLPAFHHHELPPARALIVEDHLRECVSCRSYRSRPWS